MRKSFTLAVMLMALSAGSALALEGVITEQQVRNVCGSKLQTNKFKDYTALGCERECGLKKEKLCTYNCNNKGTKDGKMKCNGLAL